MEKIVSPDEWNDIIHNYKGYRIFLNGDGEGIYKGQLDSFARAYMEEGKSWANLYIKNGKDKDIYRCALNEDADTSEFYTLSACQQIGKWIKPHVHILGEEYKKTYPDGPNYKYYDKKYDKKVVKIWSYDINSAYPFAILQEWPDTTISLGPGILENDQIGFNLTWVKEGYNYVERMIAEFEEGKECRFRFKKMPCPEKVKEWVLKQYKRKKEAKNKDEKGKYKRYLNVLAGQLRNYNTFVRATVLTRSMNYVMSYFDENTVYANVDCIYSLQPRNDLPIGTEIGMFKEEIQGEDFIYHGSIHGTNNDPRWEGVPRAWARGNFIELILNDIAPANRNKYTIDRHSGEIIERRYL